MCEEIRFILFRAKRRSDDAAGCSAVGSALGSGPRGHGFKSRHSDQNIWTDFCLSICFLLDLMPYDLLRNEPSKKGFPKIIAKQEF